MSKAITFEGAAGLPATPEAIANIARGAASVPAGGGQMFLRLLRHGEWAYGPESIEPEEGSVWAVNPMSFAMGYACWDSDSATLLGEDMRSAAEPRINPADLPDTGFPWSEQSAVQLVCVSGEDEGVQVIYKGTSVGLRRAVGGLATQVSARVTNGESALVPLVTLGTDSYNHKKYGKIFTPELNVVEWREIGDDSPVEEKTEAPPEKPRRQRRG